MKKKKVNYPSVQFGTSLMLVVFMVLCLTAFASLSLSSALRDYKYSQKSAQKTSEYYQADSKAQHKLAEITKILEKTYKEFPESYIEHATQELAGIQDITIGNTVSLQVKINDSQALKVELTLNNPAKKNSLYEVSCWKEISTKNWNSETTLPVIGSDD